MPEDVTSPDVDLANKRNETEDPLGREPFGFDQGIELSDEVIGHIVPYCIKVNRVGSLRRGCKFNLDVRLICIPKLEAVQGVLFGRIDPGNRLYNYKPLLDKIEEISDKVVRAGTKECQIYYKGVFTVIFIATLDNWGFNSILRTGPKEFNQYFLTRCNERGYTSQNATLTAKDTGRVYPGLTEEEIFSRVGIPYCSPEDREDYRVARTLEEGAS